VTINVCPACGYPTVGPDLCSYCRPVEMLTGHQTFEPMLSISKRTSRNEVSGNASPWL
jgi:hypothetical protein